MANRRFKIITLMSFALIALLLPVMTASAQEPWWRRGRDRDYGRDRYNYDRRALRDAVYRVEDRSEHFESAVDNALDRSRINGTNREDRLNDVVRQFRDASRDMKSRFNDGRDMYRSADAARHLLRTASRVEELLARADFGSRARSEWDQIRYNLRIIADAYGLQMRDYDRGGWNSRWPGDRGRRW